MTTGDGYLGEFIISFLKFSFIYIQGVDGILMWRLDIMDEMSGEPNKAGLEYIRLTQSV